MRIGEKEHITAAEFEALFRQYYPKIKAFIARIIKQEEAAEDLSQDIFVKLWDRPELIEKRIRDFDAYLFRMAKNRAYNYIEQRYIRNNHAARVTAAADAAAPTGNEVFDYVILRETEMILQIALQQMPPQRRRVFTMSRMEGLSNQQIADRLRLSKRTVDTHLSLALSELKKIAFVILFLLTD